MATTRQLRNVIRQLSKSAAADVDVVLRQADTAEQARDGLMDVLPPLIDAYSAAAGTVAAEWYDQRRERVAPRQRFTARVADLRGDGGGLELARFAVGPLFRPEPDPATARSLLEGGLQLRIANASRDTIAGSSIADPSARGWQRESAGGCAFCEMLAGRGEIYSEEGAAFAAHDHCACVAVPAFDGEPRPVKPYTPSERNISDADRTRVRAYLASS